MKDIERYASVIEETKEFYRLPETLRDYGGANEKFAAIIDLETSGLEGNCQITELGLVKFGFQKDLTIGSITDVVSMFNDPGFKISPKIVELTGVTDDMVKGKRLDFAQILDLLSDCSLIVAHNARFDRNVIERVFRESGHKFPDSVWLCSSVDPGWKDHGILSSKLDYLAFKYGFYFDHHRAVVDCLATLHVMSKPIMEGRTVFNQMVMNAFAPQAIVKARHSPFEKKDALKEAGYRWNTDEKTWEKAVKGSEIESEKEWLDSTIYCGKGTPDVVHLNVTTRFRK